LTDQVFDSSAGGAAAPGKSQIPLC